MALSRHRWPSLAESLDAHMMIAGICGNCLPTRRIEVRLEPLIERHGSLTKTRDVMDRIVCSACGSRVPVSLAPVTRPGGRDE